MRAARISLIALILLFTAVILNSVYIGKTTKQFAEAVERIDTEDMDTAYQEFKSCYSNFKKCEKYISITVSHDDLTNIEETFADIIGACEAGMRVDVITAKNRLKDALLHLGRLSGFSIESII